MRVLRAPIAVVLASLLPVSGVGAAGPVDCAVPTLDDRCEAWVATYDFPNIYNGPSYGPDEAFAVAASPTGDRLYVAGTAWSDEGSEDIVTLAYDAASGVRSWVTRDFTAQPDRPTAVAVSPDGATVFVTGTAAGDYITLAYDAVTGTARWRRAYDGPGAGYDEAEALRVTPDGETVLVTGHSTGPGETPEIATIAYDAAEGSERWVVRRDGGKEQQAYAMALSPSGTHLYLGGGIDSETHTHGVADTLAVAYELPTEEGEAPRERWSAAYDPDSAMQSGETAGFYWYGGYNRVAVSPDGKLVFVSGASAILAYEASTGRRRWRRLLDTSDVPQVIMSMVPSADGARLYVTGESSGIADLYRQFTTTALEPTTGDVIWSARSKVDGHAHSLSLSGDESTLYVTGTSCNTIAYDPRDGTQLWSALYPGTSVPRLSDCSDVAPLPGGGVAVVGTVVGDPAEDILAETNTRDLLVLRY